MHSYVSGREADGIRTYSHDGYDATVSQSGISPILWRLFSLAESGLRPTASFVISVLALRYSGLGELGIYALEISLANFLLALLPPTGQAATRIVALRTNDSSEEPRNTNSLTVILTPLQVAAWLTVLFIVVTAMYLGRAVFDIEVSPIFIAASFLLALAQYLEATEAGILRGRFRYDQSAIAESIWQGAAVSLSFLWLYSAGTAQLLIGIQLLAYTGLWLTKRSLVRQAEHKSQSGTVPHWNEFLRFSSWNWLHSLSAIGTTSLDRFAVKHVTGASQAVGGYQIAVQLGAIAHLAISSVASVSLTELSASKTTREPAAQLRQHYMFSLTLSGLFFLAWIVALAALDTTESALTDYHLIWLGLAAALLATSPVPYFFLLAHGRVTDAGRLQLVASTLGLLTLGASVLSGSIDVCVLSRVITAVLIAGGYLWLCRAYLLNNMPRN